MGIRSYIAEAKLVDALIEQGFTLDSYSIIAHRKSWPNREISRGK